MAIYSIQLHEVFKKSGVPTVTFVEPSNFTHLLAALMAPGRCIVIEGPSGVGKTSALINALRRLGEGLRTRELSAREPDHFPIIDALPTSRPQELTIVDDFHRLPSAVQLKLADYLKRLADKEDPERKLVLIGINRVGESLVSMGHDVANRVEVVRFESNSREKLLELIWKGEELLRVSIRAREDIAAAANGSFYLTQLLCHEACVRAGVLVDQPELKVLDESLPDIKKGRRRLAIREILAARAHIRHGHQAEARRPRAVSAALEMAFGIPKLVASRGSGDCTPPEVQRVRRAGCRQGIPAPPDRYQP